MPRVVSTPSPDTRMRIFLARLITRSLPMRSFSHHFFLCLFVIHFVSMHRVAAGASSGQSSEYQVRSEHTTTSGNTETDDGSVFHDAPDHLDDGLEFHDAADHLDENHLIPLPTTPSAPHEPATRAFYVDMAQRLDSPKHMPLGIFQPGGGFVFEKPNMPNSVATGREGSNDSPTDTSPSAYSEHQSQPLNLDGDSHRLMSQRSPVQSRNSPGFLGWTDDVAQCSALPTSIYARRSSNTS